MDETDPTRTTPAETTGHPVVDDVLTELAGVGELSLADQVGVFEAAHQRLRTALEDPDQPELAALGG